ncbi:MAG: xylose isomerase [Azospirillaceae bacterium]
MTPPPFFSISEPVAFEGPESRSALAFRHYDPDTLVLGRRMEDQLRFAACYWHSFCWPGGDPFGGQTFERPWFDIADPMEAARAKADVAFEAFRLLRVPFFAFHDVDIAPEAETPGEFDRNVRIMADHLGMKMVETGTGLLWGTANLFSHRRYMAGAATNPDPEVFRFAAAQVRTCLEVTHALGGQNYVMWGGREGYETLLNTDMKRELDQMGRFLALVVDHKHRLGFQGPILIEPKPKEPTKHQYDFDAAAVHAFLKAYDLMDDVRLNIEQNHALLAGHTFEHEIAYAVASGLFGSLDINRGDELAGWDTDQFPNDPGGLTIAFYHILKAGGFTTGGLNFDAKLRRQSLDPDDLLIAHVGGMDVCARALKAAAALIEDGTYDRFLAERYAGWDTQDARDMLAGKRSLAEIADDAVARAITPRPVSGRQEWLENWIARFT